MHAHFVGRTVEVDADTTENSNNHNNNYKARSWLTESLHVLGTVLRAYVTDPSVIIESSQWNWKRGAEKLVHREVKLATQPGWSRAREHPGPWSFQTFSNHHQKMRTTLAMGRALAFYPLGQNGILSPASSRTGRILRSK